MFNLGRKEKRKFTRTAYFPIRREVSVLRVKILRPPCKVQAALCPAGMSAGMSAGWPGAARGPPRLVLCVLPSAACRLVLGLPGRSTCGFCSRVTVLPPRAKNHTWCLPAWRWPGSFSASPVPILEHFLLSSWSFLFCNLWFQKDDTQGWIWLSMDGQLRSSLAVMSWPFLWYKAWGQWRRGSPCHL